MKFFVVFASLLVVILANPQAEVVRQEFNIEADGTYNFTSLEGEKFEVTYVADENGYQPKGAHLPQPHPIPEAILKAIEYIKAHPQQ